MENCFDLLLKGDVMSPDTPICFSRNGDFAASSMDCRGFSFCRVGGFTIAPAIPGTMIPDRNGCSMIGALVGPVMAGCQLITVLSCELHPPQSELIVNSYSVPKMEKATGLAKRVSPERKDTMI